MWMSLREAVSWSRAPVRVKIRASCLLTDKGGLVKGARQTTFFDLLSQKL
jgi:hypothetical protein